MKAAYIQETGGPEKIVFGELPDPSPGNGEVLVQVGAVSVNPIDTYVRGGMVPAKLPMPFVVGSDLAGTVEAVGEGEGSVAAGGLVTVDRVSHPREGERALEDLRALFLCQQKSKMEKAVAAEKKGRRGEQALLPPRR